MARKKEDKPMTRQVRIYEDDAKTIELILATRERKVTFADIIKEALELKFKGSAENILRQIEDATPENQPFDRTKRNAG